MLIYIQRINLFGLSSKTGTCGDSMINKMKESFDVDSKALRYLLLECFLLLINISICIEIKAMFL